MAANHWAFGVVAESERVAEKNRIAEQTRRRSLDCRTETFVDFRRAGRDLLLFYFQHRPLDGRVFRNISEIKGLGFEMTDLSSDGVRHVAVLPDLQRINDIWLSRCQRLMARTFARESNAASTGLVLCS